MRLIIRAIFMVSYPLLNIITGFIIHFDDICRVRVCNWSYNDMHVGKLSALRWNCITDECFIIDKSEKYNRLTKTYFIAPMKNEAERIFPLTNEIRSLLNTIKKIEIEYGYICEWVFANECDRIHAPVISSCIKNKYLQLGLKGKGIHATPCNILKTF